MRLLGSFRTVIFDCDSTLSAIEGIEELAERHREEVVALTEAAMRGEVPLEEVYGRRLELVRPDRSQVEALAERYIAALVPDARETVAALLGAGIDVRVISGGLRPAVAALGRHLGIPDEAVAAVEVRFDADGRYAGFDECSPLARAGGKAEVVREWAPALRSPVMLVGDGATDLEAAPYVDLFVAFAGVIERPQVVEAAEVVIRAASLAPVVPLALGGERPADPGARAVFDEGIRLLEPKYRSLLNL